MLPSTQNILWAYSDKRGVAGFIYTCRSRPHLGCRPSSPSTGAAEDVFSAPWVSLLTGQRGGGWGVGGTDHQTDSRSAEYRLCPDSQLSGTQIPSGNRPKTSRCVIARSVDFQMGGGNLGDLAALFPNSRFIARPEAQLLLLL